MRKTDISTEQSILQTQLTTLTAAFELAIKKDLCLVETKKIYHEIQLVKHKLNGIQHQQICTQNKENVKNEIFCLNFYFNGEAFTGQVSIGARNDLSTFIIRYAPEGQHSVENTIEIFPLIQSESEPLLWFEIDHEEGQKLIRNNLANAIGAALENGSSNNFRNP